MGRIGKTCLVLLLGTTACAGGVALAGVTGGGFWRARVNLNRNTATTDIEGEILRPGK